MPWNLTVRKNGPNQDPTSGMLIGRAVSLALSPPAELQEIIMGTKAQGVVKFFAPLLAVERLVA